MAFMTCIHNKQKQSLGTEFTRVHLSQSIHRYNMFVCVCVCNELTYRRVWWEKGPGDSVEVREGELDAGVGEAKLMYVGGSVSGADVALSGERRHGDGIFQLVMRQVVRDSSIDISLNDEREIVTHI